MNRVIQRYDGKDFDEGKRYALKSEKGNTVFVVYSKTENGTMMYAIGGEDAKTAYSLVEEFVKGANYGAEQIAKDYDSILEISENTNRNSVSDYDVPQNRSAASGNGKVSSGKSEYRNNNRGNRREGLPDSELRALINTLTDSESRTKEKFSMQLPVEETDRLVPVFYSRMAKTILWKSMVEDETSAWEELIAKANKNISGVPEATFRDTYTDFVLKRLIRMAAEEGYDSIGWTTAQQQSERWSDEFSEEYRIKLCPINWTYLRCIMVPVRAMSIVKEHHIL